MNEDHSESGHPSTPVQLSDHDWSRIEHLFQPATTTGRGRPRQSARRILDAILWACFDDHKWHRLPATYPPQQTCYTHYLKWRRDGTLTQVAEEVGIPYNALCSLPMPPK